MAKKSEINILNVTNQEINALLACPKEVRYKYALKRIADTETLWTIGFDDETILIQDYLENQYYLIWSSQEFADDFISNLKGDYVVIPISLYDFLESEQNVIKNMKYELNVFPTKTELLGMDVNLLRFIEDLNVYLDDYGEYIKTD